MRVHFFLHFVFIVLGDLYDHIFIANFLAFCQNVTIIIFMTSEFSLLLLCLILFVICLSDDVLSSYID